MARWKYLLVVIVLVGRGAELSLYYISDISDWCWYLFIGGWLMLFFLALWGLLRLRWRELVIFFPVLIATALPAVNIGRDSIVEFQDELFRRYALHRIRAVPLQQFLSKCKLVDYVDEKGAKRQVGQCDDGIRSLPWLYLTLIYDPSGQFSLSSFRRTLAWKFALRGWSGPGPRSEPGLHMGSAIAETDNRTLLVGSFYFVKLYAEEWKGDSED